MILFTPVWPRIMWYMEIVNLLEANCGSSKFVDAGSDLPALPLLAILTDRGTSESYAYIPQSKKVNLQEGVPW